MPVSNVGHRYGKGVIPALIAQPARGIFTSEAQTEGMRKHPAAGRQVPEKEKRCHTEVHELLCATAVSTAGPFWITMTDVRSARNLTIIGMKRKMETCMPKPDLDEFTQAYIEAALWSSTVDPFGTCP